MFLPQQIVMLEKESPVMGVNLHVLDIFICEHVTASLSW